MKLLIALLCVSSFLTASPLQHRVKVATHLPQIVMIDDGHFACSGSIVAEGRFLTAAHCYNGRQLYATFQDGVREPIKVVAIGSSAQALTDWCLLSGDTRHIKPLGIAPVPTPPYLSLGFTEDYKDTRHEHAIPVMIEGRFMKPDEFGENGIRVIASFVGGDSGGPLLDAHHHVIGIISRGHVVLPLGYAAPAWPAWQKIQADAHK